MGILTLALGLLTSVVMCWALCERKYIQTSSKCTDGTRPVYYFRKGYEGGSNRWHVHFQGGGWCSDVQSCFARMQSPYGGTEFDRQNVSNPNSCDDVKGHMFENTKYLTSNAKLNTMMYNWNTVFVAYCDGGSYAGDAVVEHEGRQLHFKGLDIRRSLINTLLDSEGLDKGSEVLISGCSAGGAFACVDACAGFRPDYCFVVLL
jgi:O-palmitoleoyl-L-serine hydrolase